MTATYRYIAAIDIKPDPQSLTEASVRSDLEEIMIDNGYNLKIMHVELGDYENPLSSLEECELP